MMGADMQVICDRHPEGVILLGYSQGGLLARAVLEVFGDLNVKRFISLSSPQAGQYGSMCIMIFSIYILLFSVSIVHIFGRSGNIIPICNHSS